MERRGERKTVWLFFGDVDVRGGKTKRGGEGTTMDEGIKGFEVAAGGGFRI